MIDGGLLQHVPGCENGDAPYSQELLGGGKVNRSFLVRTRRGRFVVRLNENTSADPGLDRDRELVLHGAAANRTLEIGASGVAMSACVTLIDGLVYARSAFHHSVNYRSVVVFGRARGVTDFAEKRALLDALVDRMAPGRARQVRAPNDKELHATRVIALPIDEASAKIRTGGPIDDPEDLTVPVWTGQLPVAIRSMSHIATPDDAHTHDLPAKPHGID